MNLNLPTGNNNQRFVSVHVFEPDNELNDDKVVKNRSTKGL